MSPLDRDVVRSLDELRELASLGAGWAARAFEQLVGQTVLTRLPEVHDRAHLTQSDEWSTALCFTTEGDAPGLVAVFVTPGTRERLIAALLGHRPDPPAAAQESALREFGNIVVSQTISAIANETGGRILISVPELLLEDAARAFAARLPERRAGRAAEIVECELFDPAGELHGLLVFAPDPKIGDGP